MEKSIQRYIANDVRTDLGKKMVFIAGPRQVGKTTLAHDLQGQGGLYFNWDDAENRQTILKRDMPRAPIWIFDEIHKYRSWRNYLKGMFDRYGKDQPILVTGSAKLDYYRYGGDSLQGRYHFYRMYPLSVAELNITSSEDLSALLQLSGFPEPFFSGSQAEAKRWSREYRSRLIHEDLRGLEEVQDLGQMELLSLRLPELVSSPLSINALREDLQTTHKTMSRWLQILERLYGIVRLAPFGSPKIRAIKKSMKHYHLDWSQVPADGARFENLVAIHLLKWVTYQQDRWGRELDLCYFRDVDGREVDFVITENRKPTHFIEAKWSDAEASPALTYLKERFPQAQAWQISATGQKDYENTQGVRLSPAIPFLRTLV